MTTERWEAVLARVAELGRAEVRAGIVGPKAQEIHADTGLTNAVIGLIHELGLGGLPERSFVRKTLRDPKIQVEISLLHARLVKAVLAGKMDRDRALGLLGAFVAGKIQRTIVDDQVEPELQPATVAAKKRAGLGGPGGDKVLVATGQLVGAIGFEIRK
jgi:hypothetical protein